MQVWPFVPLVSVKERVSFLTDIQQSRSAEMAINLRVPRQGLEHGYMLSDDDRAIAEDLIRNGHNEDWLLPVWTEATHLTQTIASGATNIPANTSADYRVGADAVLFSDNGIISVVEIAAVNVDSLDLAAPLAQSHVTPSVAPLRTAFGRGGITLSRLLVGLSTMEMIWVIRDNVETAETPYPQYLGEDVLLDPSVIVSPLSEGVSQSVQYLNATSGPIPIETTRDEARSRFTAAFIDETRALIWRRKKWLHHIAGRQGAFWIPSWSSDISPISPIVAGTATILPALAAPGDYVGRHIMIYGDGYEYFREITGATQVGQNHRITFDVLNASVPGAKVSYLTRARMDADDVEILHMDGLRASMSIPIMEI